MNSNGMSQGIEGTVSKKKQNEYTEKGLICYTRLNRNTDIKGIWFYPSKCSINRIGGRY
ncbi:hypothetical protein FACS1894200_14500 [Spirochaetia bacterium]|nr:hypothetical protein FACS1894200_14500 [Spirochaetia bacterium]